MKLSWRYKVTLLMMLAVLAAIIVTWGLNRTFLEDYYLYSKMDTLNEAYLIVSQMLESKKSETETDNSADEADASEAAASLFSEEDLLKLEILSTQNNLTVYILWDNIYCTTANTNESHKVFVDRLRAYLYPAPGNTGLYKEQQKLKTVENEYEVYLIYDSRTQSNYIELFAGDVEHANYVMIRSNVESMRESVEIANKFLAYAGATVTLLIAVVVLIATKAVVRPIRQLSSIAKRMSDLDFNVKYKVTTKDEIGELGQSINTLSEKLEHTISDLKSANNKLQTDIEQKVQIDEMRKEFLSNVTHELKTPIALIQGYAEGLKDNINEDAESREFYCDVIIDEAMKMNKMVKKLLTLNQIEFGNYMVEMERFDMAALIRSVLASSDILLKQNDIKLYFKQEGPLEVWADEYMMEEVVTNYLTNAIHYADKEKVVEIKAVKNEKTVRVSVFNSGQPIPEEEIDKIWVKFYKVDKARTREYGGNGIGLSIVKAIMDAHNKPYGVINHDNGVEFWFELDADA
ncbi:MAG: sensor histidine kinase [Lachnospiraceae bacterium]